MPITDAITRAAMQAATAAQSTSATDSPPGFEAKVQEFRDALNQKVRKGDNKAIQNRLRDLHAVMNSLNQEQSMALFDKLSDRNDDLSKLFNYKLARSTRADMEAKLVMQGVGGEAETRWEKMQKRDNRDKIDLRGNQPSDAPAPKVKPEDLTPQEKRLLDQLHKDTVIRIRNIRV